MTFADKAGPPVRKALNQLGEQAGSLIDPSKIRQEASKGWKSLQQPIQVSKMPECWLAVRPLSAAFSGVSSANNILRASLSATVDSSLVLGGKPNVGAPTELPPLKALAPDAPKEFTVQIPILLTYTGIREAVLSIVPLDQPIEFHVNGRQGHITIKSLEIYPSAERLVVGVQITADVPGRWLDVNGWFYLLAMPKIDADRRVVHFENLELARQTDNFLVNAATALTVIEPVRRLIEAKVEFPYGAKNDDLIAKLQQRLNAKISDEVQTTGFLARLQPGTVSLTNIGLVVPVLAQGSLEVEVGL